MIPRRRFGRTEIEMPVFTCGGMRFQHTWKDEEEIVARVIAYAMAKSTQCEEGADGLESYLVVQRSLSHAKPKVAKEVVKKPPLVCQESDEFSDFLEVVADAVDVVADTSQTGVALRP